MARGTKEERSRIRLTWIGYPQLLFNVQDFFYNKGKTFPSQKVCQIQHQITTANKSQSHLSESSSTKVNSSPQPEEVVAKCSVNIQNYRYIKENKIH